MSDVNTSDANLVGDQQKKQEIMEAALETACRLVQDLSARLVILEEKYTRLEITLNSFSGKIEEAHFNSNSDNYLNEYQRYWVSREDLPIQEDSIDAETIRVQMEELYSHRGLRNRPPRTN